MTYTPIEICDKVLQYLSDKKNCLVTDIEDDLKPNNAYPSLGELTDKKLIGHNERKSHYHIRQEGQNVIDTYGSYSDYIESIAAGLTTQKKLTDEQSKDIPINAFFRKWGYYVALAGLIALLLLWLIDKSCKS